MTLDEIITRVQFELTFITSCEVVPHDYGFAVWINITPKAQRVFGNIVTHAKQAVNYGYFSYDEEYCDADDTINDAVSKTRKFVERELTGDIIDTDATDVEITFANGVTVEFSTSEWGSIARKEV